MTEIITLTISKELRQRIDLTRGDVPRSKFISRSLEAFFNSKGRKKERNPALRSVGGPVTNAVGSSFQEMTENDYI
jgi:hypothetical protein